MTSKTVEQPELLADELEQWATFGGELGTFHCPPELTARILTALRTPTPQAAPSEVAETVAALRLPARWDAHFYTEGFGTTRGSKVPEQAAALITRQAADLAEAMSRVERAYLEGFCDSRAWGASDDPKEAWEVSENCAWLSQQEKQP